jgi:predicted dehydrogenase
VIRVGLIGCGSVADFGHAPAIRDTEGLDLVAICDPDEARLRDFQCKFGVPSVSPVIGEFLQNDLDVVVIASPPFAHLDNAVQAAKAGAHVLCEKPLADSIEASKMMVAEVAACNRMLFTGFVYRFSPVASQIRQWVRDGVVGEVRSMRLIYNWNLHGRYLQGDSGEWNESALWRGRMVEGGPLIDCGVHQIDLARWWLGSEVAHFTSAGAWVTDFEAPDHIYLHMTHASGALSTVEVSFTYGHTARESRSEFLYELIGSGGVIRYDRNGYVLEARNGQGTIVGQGASEKNFPGMYAALKIAIESGNPSGMPSGEDGIEATRIAEEATESLIAERFDCKPAKQ